MECGSLLPLFFFKAAIFGLCQPKQPKLRPLESAAYELQISQLLCFDIHTKCRGGTHPLPAHFQFLDELTLCSPVSLFYSAPRIPIRMSATISCLTPQRCSFFGTSAMPGPTLFFSTLMSDEAKSIARGLQKRDPDLLDRLIEQYHTACSAIWFMSPGAENAPKISFKKPGSASSSAATNTMANRNLKRGSLPSRGTW